MLPTMLPLTSPTAMTPASLPPGLLPGLDMSAGVLAPNFAQSNNNVHDNIAASQLNAKHAFGNFNARPDKKISSYDLSMMQGLQSPSSLDNTDPGPFRPIPKKVTKANTINSSKNLNREDLSNKSQRNGYDMQHYRYSASSDDHSNARLQARHFKSNSYNKISSSSSESGANSSKVLVTPSFFCRPHCIPSSQIKDLIFDVIHRFTPKLVYNCYLRNKFIT